MMISAHNKNFGQTPPNADIISTGQLLSVVKSQIFQGPYQGFGDNHKVIQETDQGIDCTDLHTPETLQPILEHYCQTKYPGDDRRAAISMWSQWYFGILLSPLLVLGAAGEVALPFQPGFIRLTYDDMNCPTGFMLFDINVTQMIAQSSAPDPWSHFAPLIHGHLEPLINALSQSSKVSPKVFWSNVGVVMAYVEKHVLQNTRITLTPLINDLKRPDGSRNSLAAPYSTKHVEDGSFARRVCCLRYLLTNVDTCPTCPLSKL